MGSSTFSLARRRVWVAGHRGMVGSALVRRLQSEHCTILTAGRDELDLTRQRDVEAWTGDQQPDVIVIAAARVGGIVANAKRPADFLFDNLAIELNIIEAARRAGTHKLLFLGSNCIYPKLAPQSLAEDSLLTGPLEPTNQWYAVAKIAGLKLCEAYRAQYGLDFISAMPTSLYGPNDTFDLEGGHVLPALVRKIHEAKVSGRGTVEIWGSGKPKRELMYVDDCADALVYLLQNYSAAEHINIGGGDEVTVRGLAEAIAEVVGYEGGFRYDAGKPDGTPRKAIDGSRLEALGWQSKTSLREGLERTYRWYLENLGHETS